MTHLKATFFFLAVVLALSSCGGGGDDQIVDIAEDVPEQPTVNSVQAVPAPESTTDNGSAGEAAGETNAPLPTAVTLPTAAPTPEPTVDRSQPTTYIVQSGDVLGLIAERFDADIAEVRRINGLDGNLIRVGQELTIPALEAAAPASGSSDSTESAAPAPTAAPASTASSAPVSCNSAATGHCVQPGESLLGIAIKYDVSEDELRAANPGVSGDLIKSGEVLNIPGGGGSTSTAAAAAPAAPVGTAAPVATVGPINDADCKARNPEFPYFHASDGLCYANPIGPTVVPRPAGAAAEGEDVECPVGRFLWEDGLCYAIPGVTVTPTEGPTPTASPLPNYGTVPCRDGYLPLESGRCWPEPDTTPSTVGPAATSTGSSGNDVECVEPYFTQGADGRCFLLQDGVDADCELDDNRQPVCP